MKISNIYLLFVVMGLVTIQAKAQTPVSLEQCRQQAVKYNKQLKSSRFKKEEAIANQKLARTAFYPKLDGTSSLMHIPDMERISMPGNFLPTAESAEAANAGNFSGVSDVWMPGIGIDLNSITLLTANLELQLPVYAGGKIRYGNKQAELGVKIAENAVDMTYADVIEKTDKAYWNVIAVNEQVKLAKAYSGMLTEVESQLTDMYELGLVPLSEKLKVTVQKNEAELNLIKIKNRLLLSKMVMNQVLGVNLENPFYTADTLNHQPILADTFNGTELALKNRPEIKVLSGQIKITEYQEKIVAADYKPQIGVGATYSKFYVKNLYEDGNWNTQIAGQLSIPIFHWKESKHKRKAAQMKIMQAEMELSNNTDLINLEVQQIKIKLQESYQSIDIAKRNIHETEEALSETQASFDVGLNTTTDLLNAQTEWQSARTNLIKTIAEFEVLKTTWLRVTGKLSILAHK